MAGGVLSRGAHLSMGCVVALPPCTLPSESTFVDVGRGVALIEIVAKVTGAPCFLDAGSVVRAREEGRSPPELIAFRIELDGKPLAMGGPRGRIVAEVMRGGSLRFVAAVRGDRFIAAPLSTDPALVQEKTRYRLRTRSVWGAARVAGVAQWVETGAPIVVTPDPTRDHEPLAIAGVADRKTSVNVLIVDGGPMMGGDVTVATEPERTAALTRGGVDALSVLLSDLPLAVATAPDGSTAIARLGEIARAARATSLSSDPLLVAIGQRTATAIANGFKTCVRGNVAMPARWPAPLRDLVTSGLLDEAESGCPRVDDLLATNHPDVRFAQEGASALSEAASLPFASLPRIGALAPERHTTRNGRKSGRTTIWLSALAAVLFVGLFAHRASR
jgi:hypothetical protein